MTRKDVVTYRLECDNCARIVNLDNDGDSGPDNWSTWGDQDLCGKCTDAVEQALKKVKAARG